VAYCYQSYASVCAHEASQIYSPHSVCWNIKTGGLHTHGELCRKYLVCRIAKDDFHITIQVGSPHKPRESGMRKSQPVQLARIGEQLGSGDR
jgi:hypothetical protein